ncbi:hypothetical protein [Legionella pneumophila]|uniref:hypothetical protein n=1 Tax=Legionella pneumophila TaxID=446 RepID=UPI00047F0BA8|nr:hypothetical protein [Legionella pneumophila]AMP88230.1 hypothetical protein AXF35_00315 [Legionella pneumophila subsp. pascullei]AMP91139.1 hypothetical protein AXF36_00315 [Legionella pneumophila subsp. pascullei]AMP94126.1 hypothetical protein AXF37_00315 [Legionella pneumophila subsp. pascullei]HAT6916878.1 hypothetical protein [Legionella pneumophila]HAT6920531.1 hypothetical protein [Legionella pneumophila]
MNCIKGIREDDGAWRNNLLSACGGFCLLGSEKQKARPDPLALCLITVDLPPSSSITALLGVNFE